MHQANNNLNSSNLEVDLGLLRLKVSVNNRKSPATSSHKVLVEKAKTVRSLMGAHQASNLSSSNSLVAVWVKLKLFKELEEEVLGPQLLRTKEHRHRQIRDKVVPDQLKSANLALIVTTSRTVDSSTLVSSSSHKSASLTRVIRAYFQTSTKIVALHMPQELPFTANLRWV